MSNAKKATPVLKSEQKDHLSKLTQTASKIRYLSAEGFDRGSISRILGIRYQWVRNVLITPLKNA